MRNLRNEPYESVVNDIRLQLRNPSSVGKVWLLVEGDSDYRFYLKMFSDRAVSIIPTSGIYVLLAVLDAIMNETNRIFAIRDADFFHLNMEQVTLPDNLFMTDCHDIEMMMIACDEVFCSVLVTHTSLSPSEAIKLRKPILHSIAFLGGIRWINNISGLKLDFDKLPLNKFYDGKNMKLDEEECVSLINTRSKYKSREITISEISHKIDGITDFYNLCQGHDAMKALSAYITSLRKDHAVKHDRDITNGFIQAYHFNHFQQTQLFKDLQAWTECQGIAIFI